MFLGQLDIALQIRGNDGFVRRDDVLTVFQRCGNQRVGRLRAAQAFEYDIHVVAGDHPDSVVGKVGEIFKLGKDENLRKMQVVHVAAKDFDTFSHGAVSK